MEMQVIRKQGRHFQNWLLLLLFLGSQQERPGWKESGLGGTTDVMQSGAGFSLGCDLAGNA
jgi:hypothetical protein